MSLFETLFIISFLKHKNPRKMIKGMGQSPWGDKQSLSWSAYFVLFTELKFYFRIIETPPLNASVVRIKLSLIMQLNNMAWRYMGAWRHRCTIVGLGTRWKTVVTLTFRLLYPWGKGSLHTLDKRLYEHRSQSESCRERKLTSPFQESNPARPA
jgi:hypothetical protein